LRRLNTQSTRPGNSSYHRLAPKWRDQSQLYPSLWNRLDALVRHHPQLTSHMADWLINITRPVPWKRSKLFHRVGNFQACHTVYNQACSKNQGPENQSCSVVHNGSSVSWLLLPPFA